MAIEKTPKAGYLTPLLHVADIDTSIRFYELLGFKVVDTDRCEPLGWARLHCEGAAIMFLLSFALKKNEPGGTHLVLKGDPGKIDARGNGGAWRGGCSPPAGGVVFSSGKGR